MKYLDNHNKLAGKNMLDYGCGKGMDAQIFNMDKYDPHYTGGRVVESVTGLELELKEMAGLYETVTCNYVMNVIEDESERAEVLTNITSLLCPGGKAYITVRRDPQVVEGYTKTGTYQSAVELDLPVLVERKGKFIIYVLKKDKT